MSARAPRPAAAAALLAALALTGFPAAGAPGAAGAAGAPGAPGAAGASGAPGAAAALAHRLDGVSSRGLPPGCLYEGRWFSGGAAVPTGEACLQCACAAGALSCRRRACAALPDPPPHRCHVLHRRGSCCPELHCPDGVQVMEHGASARSEDEEDIGAPRSPAHACVEGGTVYAAGSAMRGAPARACEQCFCLRGARRCVRPACLPPPPGCRARAAPGLCCPQRYYCEHSTRTTQPPHEKHPHDCKVNGKWVSEGEKVVEGAGAEPCTACFCLRGAVRCQALACAPPLLGCTPRLRAGHCCAHQYHCAQHDAGPPMSQFLTLSSIALTTARKDNDASLSQSEKETTTKTTLASIYLVKNTRITSATNNVLSTTKVKRKTSDPPPPETSSFSSQNATAVVTTRTTEEPTTTVKLPETAHATSTTSEASTELVSTEQPEGSVRIMINGTINCTAELSSTSLPLNFTSNVTDAEELDKITVESHPRTPLIDVSTLEDHTFSPNDIITDRNLYGDFDESESFVINVTSSLRTNTSQPSTAQPAVSKSTPDLMEVSIPTDIAEALNSSKKTKGDYDFDYTEPTLPPSLPNLKIIPFVAADAVVEEEHRTQAHTYAHEREDKFPVYYPALGDKDTSFTRREDVYQSTQYPVFITDKGEQQYPPPSQHVDPTSSKYSSAHNDVAPSGSEYTAPTSLEGHFDQNKAAVTVQPASRTTFNLDSPKLNLFSPPVETEGGFVPKGPSGLIDEYYAVFPSTPGTPSTPSTPSMPSTPLHLTTSMPLDITKDGECVSSEGRRVPPGGALSAGCSECRCAWGALQCAPRACAAPPPRCRRAAARSSGDLQCCGELVCEEENKQTTTSETETAKETSTPLSYTTTAPGASSPRPTEAAAPSASAHATRGAGAAPATATHSGAQGATPQSQNASKATIGDDIKINSLISFTAAATTTETVDQFTKPTPSSTTPAPPSKQPQPDDSLEYEEEEEEEEGGFSFGNVLKLLLSGDSYDTTTVAPKRLPTTSSPPPVTLSSTPRARTTPRRAPPSTVSPFVPLPALPFLHAKLSQHPINRIDHLVLGEATAIKRTTARPQPPPATTATTRTEPPRIEEQHSSTESAWPPAGGGGLSGLGGGLLKLAGCNIYGRMYRVGRIIAELSTPCQECWCTELGVHCKDLKC